MSFYTNIKNIIKKTNTLSMYDICIGGENIKSIYNIITILGFLEKHMKNDTYHPYLFRYMVSSSTGTIGIDFILKARYLYEKIGKNEALEFIENVYKFINFDNIRATIFDIGNEQLNLFNILSYPKILNNILKKQSLCLQDSLRKIILGEDKRLNAINYFNTDEYTNWLFIQLKYVFLLSFITRTSSYIVYTGNTNLTQTRIYLKRDELLLPENYVDTLIGIISIPFVYPPTSYTDFVGNTSNFIDTSLFTLTSSAILLDVQNNTLFLTPNERYDNVFNFFEIDQDEKADNFLVKIINLNTQREYENSRLYQSSSNTFLSSLSFITSYIDRLQYYSLYDINTLSVLINKPHISEFSNNNKNYITDQTLEFKKTILNRSSNQKLILDINSIFTNIPTLEDVKDIDNDYGGIYKNIYNTIENYNNLIKTYRQLTSNQSYTSFFNSFEKLSYKLKNQETFINIYESVNICYMRSIYEYPIQKYLELFLNIKDENFFIKEKNTGVLASNILYNEYIQQQYYNTYGTNNCKNFKDIIDISINKFVNK